MRALRKIAFVAGITIAVLLISFILAVKVFGLNEGAFNPEKMLFAVVALAVLLAFWMIIRLRQNPVATSNKR